MAGEQADRKHNLIFEKMNQKLVFSLAVKKEVPFGFEERNS